MRYEIVAETYRDLEQATGRLALIDQLAGLFKQTPNDLLPTVALQCPGPDRARLRRVGATGWPSGWRPGRSPRPPGTTPEQVLAGARELGDLGLTAEQLLGELEPDRPATLEVATVVEGLHQIAEAQGTGLAGPQAGRAGRPARPGDAAGGPLPGAHLYRQPAPGDRHRHHPGRPGRGACRGAEAAIDSGAGLQHFSDLSLVAATLVDGGLAAVERMEVRAGNPVPADAGPAAQRTGRDPRQAGRGLRGLSTSTTASGCRPTAHRMASWSCAPAASTASRPSSRGVKLLGESLRPREAILEGEVVAFDPVSELRPFQDVMFRRRKYGITEAVQDFPVSMFCFELLYADGTDLTRLPYLERRARLAEAITPSPRLRWPPPSRCATPRPWSWCSRPPWRGLRGADLQVAGPHRPLPGRGAGLCSGSSSSATTAPSSATPSTWSWWAGWPAGAAAPGWARGAAAGRLRPRRRTVQTICKCGTDFSDAELAARTRLAPLARAQRPAEVDSRWAADVWFEPTLVVEVLAAELTLSPHHTAAWGLLKEDAGLALRFPRFTGRWRDDKSPAATTALKRALALFSPPPGGPPPDAGGPTRGGVPPRGRWWRFPRGPAGRGGDRPCRRAAAATGGARRLALLGSGAGAVGAAGRPRRRRRRRAGPGGDLRDRPVGAGGGDRGGHLPGPGRAGRRGRGRRPPAGRRAGDPREPRPQRPHPLGRRRLAASGYSALAIDLLSAEGGTRRPGRRGARPWPRSARPPERFVADMQAGLDELARRAPRRSRARSASASAAAWCGLLASGEPTAGGGRAVLRARCPTAPASPARQSPPCSASTPSTTPSRVPRAGGEPAAASSRPG